MRFSDDECPGEMRSNTEPDHRISIGSAPSSTLPATTQVHGEVDVGRGEVVEALAIASMVAMLEVTDLGLELGRGHRTGGPHARALIGCEGHEDSAALKGLLAVVNAAFASAEP